MAASNSADVVEHQAWLGHLFAEDRSGEDSTCDLILTSEGKEFHVHKNVVMLVSKFFKKMFTIEMKEKYEGVVEVKQIPHQRLSNIIEFIYSGRISITEENVTEILDDAEYTQMEALKSKCRKYFLNVVSADNCLKIQAYAQRYNLEEVQDKTNQVIKEHLEAIVKQEDFLQLDVDNLSAILKQRSKVHEEAVFTGILDWVNHNPLQREDLFVTFFCQLDLTSMTSVFLAKIHREV
uniref:Kelch-like protein 20 n=1 Tax=Phallusia mammillata TaxID=59560 RepID=A0A6F9DGR9_9ASCI|nr:kelch-like protein 20 [Phallusia mammillata]